VEGSSKAEKDPRFDSQQQSHGVMAGTQRYLRYIVFALIVCRPVRSVA
jgi:hypothetical protein